MGALYLYQTRRVRYKNALYNSLSGLYRLHQTGLRVQIIGRVGNARFKDARK
jgi:hypothetical protein